MKLVWEIAKNKGEVSMGKRTDIKMRDKYEAQSKNKTPINHIFCMANKPENRLPRLTSTVNAVTLGNSLAKKWLKMVFNCGYEG